ncbi:MAG: hypothetical protein K1X71_12820 [Pirellulales bacterium]|nr:hypothetical protein [Pirellulales bacterium]
MNDAQSELDAQSRAEIEGLVARLDALVPQEEAAIAFEQYGGDLDESKIVANQRGFLRFGVEMLKSAILPTGEEGDLPIDIRYLQTEPARIRFDWIVRRDRAGSPVPADQQTRSYMKDRLALVTCGVVVFAVAALAIVGLFTLLTYV